MFDWVNRFPVVAWAAVLLVAMLAAAAAGSALRLRWFDSGDQDSISETREGYIVSAVVTLLAFMIGFTFTLVMDRYENRRQLVGEDARAIKELYLRAQMLDQPHRARFSDLLVRYTDNRIELATRRLGDSGRRAEDHQRLIRELWNATIPAFETIRGIDFSSAFVDSANRVIELDDARIAARAAQVPGAVFLVLFVYSTVTAFVLGYVLTGSRSRTSGVVLLALLIMAMMLLVDLNQPVAGTVRESQLPLELLRAWLHANPPEAFGGVQPPPRLR